VGRVTIAVLLIATFEGAVRKWVPVPGLGMGMILIRDLLVIGALWRGLREGCFPWIAPIIALVTFSLLVLLWAALQIAWEQVPLAVVAIGIRGWLLYLWFGVLIWRTLDRPAVERVLEPLMILLIPMAVLATIQFGLPKEHWLNKQIDDDASTVYTVAFDLVRTTGTFSFNIGYGVFVGLAAAPALACAIGDLERWRDSRWRYLPLSALVVATVVSGSRGLWAQVLLEVLGFLGVLMMMKRLSLWQLGGIVMGGMITIGLVPVVFEKAFGAIISRVLEAQQQGENFFERALCSFAGYDVWDRMDLLGAGLGLGNNAASQFMGKSVVNGWCFLLAETEPAKILLEMGLIGAFALALKWWVAILGLGKAGHVALAGAGTLPVTLWIYAALMLTIAQITSNLGVHAFGWIAIGLAGASLIPGNPPEPLPATLDHEDTPCAS